MWGVKGLGLGFRVLVLGLLSIIFSFGFVWSLAGLPVTG